MRLNLFQVLHKESISLQDFQKKLRISTEELLKKLDGVQDFTQQELAVIHQLLSQYDLKWLLENNKA